MEMLVSLVTTICCLLLNTDVVNRRGESSNNVDVFLKERMVNRSVDRRQMKDADKQDARNF